MHPTADIAVIGGGVAALAAVRALQQRGVEPLRIAPARSRAGNRGELLGPRAVASLATLEWRHLLADGQLALPVEARYSAWGSPAVVRAPVDPGLGAGWYVDRTALETAMLADVARPARHLDAAVTGCDREGDGFRLALSTGETARARFVVDASGRAAALSRRLGNSRRRESGLVAMHGTIAVPDSAVMAASLIESAPGGWWYSSAVPGGARLFIAYFTDADLLPADASRRPGIVDELLAAAPLTRSRLESLDAAVRALPWRIVVASTVLPERVAGDGWAVAGDAAVALDPLSGHGLTVALWSSIQVATAAIAWREGDSAPVAAFQEAVSTGMQRFVADADRHYRAERRFRDRPFWARRHAGVAEAPTSGMSPLTPGP